MVGDALCKPSSRPGPGHPASGHRATSRTPGFASVLHPRVPRVHRESPRLPIHQYIVDLVVNGHDEVDLDIPDPRAELLRRGQTNDDRRVRRGYVRGQAARAPRPASRLAAQ